VPRDGRARLRLGNQQAAEGLRSSPVTGSNDRLRGGNREIVMRVTEKDDRLIVRTPWVTGCSPLIFGLIFAMVGLAVFWTFGRAATLTCIRLEAAEVRCEIKQTLLGLAVRRVEAANPRQAIIQESEDSEGDTTYRVALVTAGGTVPLTEHYASGSVRDLTAQINQFLSAPGARALALDQPPAVWIYLFPFCFTGFGVLMLLTIRFDTYTFDLGRGTLFIQREKLLGTQRQTEPLSGIKAEVRESRDSDGDATYSVYLRLATGANHALGHTSSSRESQQKLADRITEFIKPGARIRYVDVR
jgi:hypothetical protein